MSALITTTTELEELIKRLADAPAIALDTEFLWERTYYPILGLVQVAPCDGEAYLIDALALPDLTPLRPILESSHIVKIFHDAPQDMRIISRAAGNAHLRNIFDTRIAAGFAHLKASIGLQALLKELFNITISKSETRSNWLSRPLSAEQLAYAREDVIYLHRTREELISRCVAIDCLHEELAKLDILEPPMTPGERWIKIKGSSALSPDEKSILRQLAIWREEYAMQHDRPRNSIARDELLINLAKGGTLPTKGFARSLTPQLLDHLRELAKQNISPAPIKKRSLERTILRQRANKLIEAITARASQQGIDPALIITRHSAEQFILHGTQPNDWRKNYYLEVP